MPAIDGPSRRATLTIERIERDRVRQIVLVLDHRDEERLAPGHVERVDDALDHVQHDDRFDGDAAAERQRREDERLQHRDRLRDHEQPAAVPAIDEDAGERAEKKRRKLPREPDDPEQQRRSGQPIDQPAGRGRRDPRAGQ